MKSIQRKYAFLATGRIALSENLSFAHKGSKGPHYQHFLAGPESPWEISKATYESEKLTDLGSTRHELLFSPKAAEPGDVTSTINVLIDALPVPTVEGYQLDFSPQCIDSPVCEVEFTGLPAGTTAQLLSRPDAASGESYVLREKSTEIIHFDTRELAAADVLRLHVSEPGARALAKQLWSKAKIITTVATEISVKQDGIVAVQTHVKYEKEFSKARLAFLSGPAEGSRYQIARTHQVNDGYFGDYIDSELKIDSDATKFSYSLLGSATRSKNGKESFVIPLPALTNRYSSLGDSQDTPEFITTHDKIVITAEPGYRLKPYLSACSRVELGRCSGARQVEAKIETTGNTITLLPNAAQISGLWLLRLEVAEGVISKPGFWTKFTFGLSHYSKFGKYPRWAFWFYFLTIIASLVGAIILFVWLGKRKRRRVEELRLQKLEAEAIADLLQRDPEFSVEAFKGRGREIAEKIQHAWCAGDMRACRRFLSQGVYNRFRLQLKIMSEIDGTRNIMADFKIRSFHIWNHNRSGDFDCLTVRLNAEARDITVNADLTDAESQKQVKSARLDTFTEFYSFMRRRDAHSANHEKTNQCSHCGTPFESEGEITKCRSCGAVAGSGTFDWVLTEITQAVEYKGSSTGKSLGDLSADRLEDRASFVFWRDLMAQMTANRACIARDATDEYVKPMVLEKKQPLFNIAVGAADLETHKLKGDLSRVKVRIKWSAAGSRAAEVKHRQSLITLICPTATAATGGFAEHSCPACGAPLPETDSIECTYCHSSIQSKNADWLLEAVETSVE